MKIAVASGKGGTGKTTVATNLARVLARQVGSRDGHPAVFLADCDVEAPNAHIFLAPQITEEWDATIPVPQVDSSICDGCGECSEICRFNALAVVGSGVAVFPELCHGCGGCQLVCPLKAIEENPNQIGSVQRGICDGLGFVAGCLNIGQPQAVPLIRQVKAAIPTEPDVVFDAPPGASCPMIEVVRGVDFVILVAEPTPFGLNDLRIAVETMRKLAIPFGIVINRAGLGGNQLEEYCVHERIPILKRIPDDRRVAEAYSRGHLIGDSLPEYRASFITLLQRVKEVLEQQQMNPNIVKDQQ